MQALATQNMFETSTEQVIYKTHTVTVQYLCACVEIEYTKDLFLL